MSKSNIPPKNIDFFIWNFKLFLCKNNLRSKSLTDLKKINVFNS